ncbi:5-oxoprolinase subunit PxpB [Idiomarina xiamenensis]|uniref:Allophanate hydrolase 2 subunit 1 n=1 Tax=Idiomarina xiamenensis 10-D-4 TaxID=740709 RepID=K2LAI4_9GAMM|nr:5-oxoprolinase subunit PxpB [Idiomarina xiamenensis]EKE86840.1 allophanate hydrolase 2 subunit 1 [Idiomarina xiamenensis 10-D-4]
MNIQCQRAAINAWLLVLDNRIAVDVSERVHAVNQAVRELGTFIMETSPAYASILVYFDIRRVNAEAVRDELMDCATRVLGASLQNKALQNSDEVKPARQHEVPVCYGYGEHDLAAVAEHCGLSVAEVIEYHQQTTYRVYALGFAPGFAYLGELDERIRIPRLATPRAKVPAGSVAIAEAQTAIYPIASPGGWRILGRTPMPLFDPAAQPMCPLQPGDEVRFVAIDEQRFEQWLLEVNP